MIRRFLPFAALGVVALSLVPKSGIVPVGAGPAWADSDTLIISRGKLHRRGGAAAETLVVDKKDGDTQIRIGDRRHITIDKDSDRDGDVVLMGDDVIVKEDEVIDGNVVSVGGSVTVLGKVLGDAVAVGGSVTLGDSAVVSGDAVSVGGGVERADGAKVGGQVVNVGVHVPLPFVKAPHSKPQSHVQGLFRWLVFYLIVFAFAALCIYAAKDRLGYASAYLGREPVPSFLLGVLSPAMALVAFVLLCITVIGIPVALALIFLYPVFMFMGWVVVGHRIGSSVKGDPTVAVRTVFTGLVVISGLHMLSILLKLVGVTGVPVFLVQMAGITLSFTAALVGLGAILGTRFRRPPDPAIGASYPSSGPPGYPGSPITPAPAVPPSPYAPPTTSAGFTSPPPDVTRGPG